MKKSTILIGFIIMLCIAFTVLQFKQAYFLSSLAKSFIVPLFTVLYFINVRRKSLYFMWFMLLFSFSEITIFLEYFIETDEAFNIYYLFGNLLYIAAYILLLLEVYKTLDIKMVFKNYIIHLIVLAALNIYIVYVLLTIVNPYVEGSFLFVVELVYNIVMLLLLTTALISYFYNDNKKSLLLFFGSICIVFSEVIQVAYYYISDKDLLNLSQTLLFIVAFCFFYFQSKIRNEKVRIFA